LGGEKKKGDIFPIPKRFFSVEMEFILSISKELFMGWGAKFDHFYIILV
jgi:hypothetical protein